MIKFIDLRFLRVIKLTKAEKNLPLSAEDYMLTFIPDYLKLVRKDCKVLECNVDEITGITTAKEENRYCFDWNCRYFRLIVEKNKDLKTNHKK